MPDEANPHYSTMLEQLITGNYLMKITFPGSTFRLESNRRKCIQVSEFGRI